MYFVMLVYWWRHRRLRHDFSAGGRRAHNLCWTDSRISPGLISLVEATFTTQVPPHCSPPGPNCKHVACKLLNGVSCHLSRSLSAVTFFATRIRYHSS